MIANTIALSLDMIIVLSILSMTVFLSFFNIIRIDLVALLVLVVLGITTLLSPQALFSGFASEAVISLIAIMMMSSGLEKSGVALRIARWMLKIGRERPSQINLFLMLLAGFLSAFIRSLGSVALLLPVVNRISIRSNIPKKRLLMPMAFCAVLGGTLSMIGSSSLILVNSLLAKASEQIHLEGGTLVLKPFAMLSVFPVGLVLLFLGIAYFMFFLKRLLPKGRGQALLSGAAKEHFSKIYGKGVELFELHVRKNSRLVGLNLQEIESLLDPTASILAVISDQHCYFPPLRNRTLQAGDFIALMGHQALIQAFTEAQALVLEPKLKLFAETLHPARSGLCETVLPPGSQLIGLELRTLHMKRDYQVNVLAVYRDQTVYRGEALKSLVLRSGDTLGMFSDWQALANFHKNPDFVVVTTIYPQAALRPQKAVMALCFFAVSLLMIIFEHCSVSIGLLLGASGMIASGVLSIDEAYESVSWKTVFLMAGFMPLGLAMQSTGTTDWLTQYSLLLKGDCADWAVQALLAIVSTLMGYALLGVGATIVLVPIAIDIAFHSGANPALYALIVALASNNSFLMPNQQVNVLIAGPGGYSTRDFLRVGSGMTLLYWLGMLLMVNLCFG